MSLVDLRYLIKDEEEDEEIAKCSESAVCSKRQTVSQSAWNKNREFYSSETQKLHEDKTIEDSDRRGTG